MRLKADTKQILASIPYKNWSLNALLFNFLLVGLILLLGKHIPPKVPLFYGKPYGSEQLADQKLLLLPPLLAAGISAVNTSINTLVDDDFLRKVMLGSIAACTTLGTITVIKIIFLVGSF